MIGHVQSATDVYAQFQAYLGLTAATAIAPATAGAVCTPCKTTLPPESAQPEDWANLTRFERARVTCQEQRSAESGRSYSFSATLVYERIAYSQSAQRSVDPGAAPTPARASAPADLRPSPDTPVVQPTADDAAVPVANRTLRHIVINATTLTYRMLSAHITTSPNGAAAPPVATQSAPVAGTEPVADEPPRSDRPAIARLSSDEFSMLRSRTVERVRETQLTLKLTTQEGDLVELHFRQLDLSSQLRLRGVTDAGDHVRLDERKGGSERFVDMQIRGDLSDAEKTAIDAVLQTVIDVANQFFKGDLRAAIERLSDTPMDTEQLAEFTLNMSLSQSREASKVRIDEDGQVQQRVHADRGMSQLIEYLADQQHALINAAKTWFDDHSAVKLVRELLPVMVAPPVAAAPDDPAAAPVADTMTSA